MKIFAIADPHLSFGDKVEKPMDIFGPEWVNHAGRLRENWLRQISEEDTVLVAGDISWAMKLEEALADLEWLDRLPGRKILVKGNHDLWWSSIGKLSRMTEEGSSLFFIQNNFAAVGKIAVCGTRGWLCPGSEEFSPQDEKIYRRELIRLEFSLEEAEKAGFREKIGMLHFPPTNDKKQPSGFTELFSRYGVSTVIYGHLHGREGFRKGMETRLDGTEYRLVSLDYLQCRPLMIADVSAGEKEG